MQIKSRQKSRAGAPGSALIAAESSDESVVLALDAADLSVWEPWNFSGETRYTPVQIDGRRAVMAVSDSSASGYYRKLTVDLHKTPVMRWSWRVDNTYGEVDEASKEGDDSPARVYVLATHPVLFWKTRALAYIWSSAQPEGSDWPNAYMSNERVIALRSGDQGLCEGTFIVRKLLIGIDAKGVNIDLQYRTRQSITYEL